MERARASARRGVDRGLEKRRHVEVKEEYKQEFSPQHDLIKKVSRLRLLGNGQGKKYGGGG